MGYRIQILLAILILLTVLKVARADGWYCNEVASEWMQEGKILRTCGIGTGTDENEARLQAYNNAKKEFELICNQNTTCANKVINIDPQRTECTPKDKGYTCHRLFYYHITNEERKTVVEVTPEPHQEIKQITEVHNHNEKIINNNYITIQQQTTTPKEAATSRKPSDNSYRTFIRKTGGVTVYQTNSNKWQGVYLSDPSEDELERAIKRGNGGGGMNTIYILNRE